MPPSYTIDALYAVGRNVVNFQRLEQILKRLAMMAPICAPLSKLQSAVENQKATSERLTLGGAVKTWIESANHMPKQQQGLEPDNEIIVTFGFELPWSPEYFDQVSAELESLLRERNNLVHLDLAQLNFEDEAECTALRIRLDAQNVRIEKASEVLGALLRQMRDLAQRMASDEAIAQRR